VISNWKVLFKLSGKARHLEIHTSAVSSIRESHIRNFAHALNKNAAHPHGWTAFTLSAGDEELRAVRAKATKAWR
jgi:hypothetical protein